MLIYASNTLTIGPIIGTYCLWKKINKRETNGFSSVTTITSDIIIFNNIDSGLTFQKVLNTTGHGYQSYHSLPIIKHNLFPHFQFPNPILLVSKTKLTFFTFQQPLSLLSRNVVHK
uniref:(northern house mosquito) hypothetical protein n=1 Tax=Culex pipiens TaxID=7175 RepID=A0A8D8CM34_CULPI